MVQVDHPLVAGQLLVQREETVAVPEAADGAVVDGDRAFGEAVADHRHLFQVAGVEVAVLELADGLERFEAGNALFQVHGCSLAIMLASPQ
ncbi:hypothetical protein D3C85_1319950 [compost metagenome]